MITSRVQDLRHRLEYEKGKRNRIEQDLKICKRRIRELKKSQRHHEQAREVVREAGLRTQRQLEYHISDVVTMAFEAIFDDPYSFEVEFVQRRNKTECDLWFGRDGNKVDPVSSSGGGVVDVASFALRVAAWSMQRPRTRPVLLLDEPFKHLSTELLPKAAEMLKRLSDQLGIQVIMVTHSEELAEVADQVFRVSMRRGVSMVTSS